MENQISLPMYVSLDGTALRKDGYSYYRDAGNWWVKYVLKNDKLYSTDNGLHEQLNNIELILISEEEWFKQNKDHLPLHELRKRINLEF